MKNSNNPKHFKRASNRKIFQIGNEIGDWKIIDKFREWGKTNVKFLLQNQKTKEKKYIYQSNIDTFILGEMSPLAKQIKLNWKDFITYLNSKLRETVFGWTAKEFYLDLQTEQRTQQISPLVSKCFYEFFNSIGIIKRESDGFDFLWEGYQIENKLSLSSEINWTGNGYKKVSIHLLMKINLNDDFQIDKSFVGLISLDVCHSKWTKPQLSSNFSSLSLHKNDFNRIHIIHGELQTKTKYLYPILN